MVLFSKNATYPPPLAAATAAAHDKAIGALVVASLDAARRLAPLRLRAGHTARCAPLATTVGMVARVHRRAAHLRPATEPALAPGLAEADVLVVDIPDLADRRQAVEVDHAHLAGGHAQGGVVA